MVKKKIIETNPENAFRDVPRYIYNSMPKNDLGVKVGSYNFKNYIVVVSENTYNPEPIPVFKDNHNHDNSNNHCAISCEECSLKDECSEYNCHDCY